MDPNTARLKRKNAIETLRNNGRQIPVDGECVFSGQFSEIRTVSKKNLNESDLVKRSSWCGAHGVDAKFRRNQRNFGTEHFQQMRHKNDKQGRVVPSLAYTTEKNHKKLKKL